MAYITTIDPTLATGDLDRLYRAIAGSRGGVADVHQVQSLNPRAMATHFEFYKAVMFQPSTLPRRDREAIAVEVSRANGCDYCVAHHRAALDALPGMPTPPALLAWARRLASDPAQASVDDIEQLRHLGLDDRAILDAVLTVGYFCFVNRLVLATGLSVEPGYEATCRPELEG